jgi:hypothetical protein
MNNNPNNVKEGQKVLLDKEFANKNEVTIYKLTPNEMFATIYSGLDTGDMDMWQVMTSRLSPITN